MNTRFRIIIGCVTFFLFVAVQQVSANHICGQTCDQLTGAGICTHGCIVLMPPPQRSTVTGTIMFTNLRLQNHLSTIPSPTPVPDKPVINITLALEGRTNHTIKTLVYQVVPGGERLLGQVQTDSNGIGSIQVSDASLYSDQNLSLFVEVPGYLRTYQQSLVRSSAVQGVVGFSKPGVIIANFGLMTAGDVRIDDATGFGDHQINSVDVADMYTQWSTANASEGNPEFSGLSGDLNGDGIVNNRDYAILMMNFGKKAGVVK